MTKPCPVKRLLLATAKAIRAKAKAKGCAATMQYLDEVIHVARTEEATAVDAAPVRALALALAEHERARIFGLGAGEAATSLDIAIEKAEKAEKAENAEHPGDECDG